LFNHSIEEQKHWQFNMEDDSPDRFATPRQEREGASSTASPNSNNSVTLARSTLVLDSACSSHSTLAGDSTRTNASVLLEDSDNNDELILFEGGTVGPTYMSRQPLSNGLVLEDIEEDKQEEGNGGDSDIKGEAGK
jgi:hypothetical protein